MIKDALGDRMKRYEAVSKTTLVSRMPVIIRLDGCHFHTFCRGFEKPFDPIFAKTMQATMKYLCENIQGCVLGYTQSDEITLVLVDYRKHNSSAWFDNEVQKVCSVSAALATYAFNKYFKENASAWIEKQVNDPDRHKLARDDPEEFKKINKLIEVYDKAIEKGAYFDSRAFNVPREDVTNCVLWRQLDAERNSINSLAQSLFSHKELQGLNLKATLTKIEQEKGIIWGNLSTTQKRGSCCIKADYFGDKRIHLAAVEEEGDYYLDDEGNEYFERDITFSTKWWIDNDIPVFKDQGRDYIEQLINVGE